MNLGVELAPCESLSVALLNDQPLVVAGLARMIRDHSSDIRITDVELGGSGVAAVDIALFDPADSEGIHQQLLRLRKDCDVAHVAIYTWHLDEELLRTAETDASVTIILKSLSGKGLVDELRRIAASNKRTRPVETRNRCIANPKPPRLPLDLSARERYVVVGAASGLTNKELADQTGLSENTIKTYLARAMQKTGTRNRAALAAWASHHGLVRFD